MSSCQHIYIADVNIDVIVKFYCPCRVSLVNFRSWFNFHVNIITDSGVMAIFVCKGLNRNREIRNTLVYVLQNV